MIMEGNNLESLKGEINFLKVELSKRENNFSEKRAQFKELYVRKEQELLIAKTEQNEILSEFQKVKNELIDIQSAAALSELIRKEELDSMKQLYNKEISSINEIMKNSIESVNETKQELENKIMKLELEKIDLNRRLDEKNSELVNNNENILIKIAQRLKMNTQEIFKGLKENLDDNMEEDLSKARIDAEFLKSVVQPYEEDAAMLKNKIREAYEKIDQLEALNSKNKLVDNSEQIVDLKNELNQLTEHNNFLKETLNQITNKYFDTENKLLRNEKLFSESKKLQLKTCFLEDNNVSKGSLASENEQFMNQLNNCNRSSLLRSNLRKSLSGNDIKQTEELYKSSSNNARRNTDIQSLNDYCAQNISDQSTQKRRVITENEWSRMQLELAALKNRASGICEMCKNYEDQLQTVQKQLKEKERQNTELCSVNKDNLRLVESLQETNNKLCCQINNEIENSEKAITRLTEELTSHSNFSEHLRSSFDIFRDVTDKELKRVNNERREMKMKMEKIELAYDNLLCKHIEVASEINAESGELPNDTESIHIYLKKLKDNLILNRAANEHLNSTLQSINIFNKEKEKGEKEEKEAFINEYNNEKKELEAQIDQLKSELLKVKKYAKSSENLEETVRVLKMELDTVKKNFVNLEIENKSIKSKSLALQQELENSESVQQDFVRLSQNLQIQLEKIRQEEKELRWQFKDDVLDCNDCQNDMSTTSDRKKYRCKHCGKIFCKNCLVEIAAGSNSRKANVCKVCHTLLVKDAVPYFSKNRS